MPNLELTYFDFQGGRGEPPRLAMLIGGIAFEDNRVSFDDCRESKASFPFRALPVPAADGQAAAQSNGINRLVGALAGLYPADHGAEFFSGIRLTVADPRIFVLVRSLRSGARPMVMRCWGQRRSRSGERLERWSTRTGRRK